MSDDGMVFDRMFYLVGREDLGPLENFTWRDGMDYPMVLEHGNYLYVLHSGGLGGQKQSVELQRVRLTDLDRLIMQDARADLSFP
ncbi:hypothetical protein RZS08_66315, partial [Arthrospira platensis SPKY1]|nr:hypothetical protein [Arthrospira platensis SPKY1]